MARSPRPERVKASISSEKAGALPDDPLIRRALPELGKEAGQLGMDGSAVVALHEVLDDQLPVGIDLVGDRFPDCQRPNAVALKLLQFAEAID
jgi:hypothetical protein